MPHLSLIMAKRIVKSESSTAKNAGAPPVVLLTGPDIFQQHHRTAEMKAELSKQHGEIDVITFDGASAKAGDVLDECRSFGMIASYKLVIVDNAEALVKEEVRDMFARYAAAPCDSATLLLRAGSRWYKSKFDDLVHKISCDGLSHGEAVGFALKAARDKHRADIDQDAAELLVERLGPDAGLIDAELGKLACAAITDTKSKSPPLITVEVVQQFVGMRKDEEVWAIQESLLNSDRETVLEQLRRMIDVSRISPVVIHFAITDLARKLHGVAGGLRSGANEWGIAKSLKLWGPSKDMIVAIGKRIDPDRARKLLRVCVEADHRVKSGFADHELTVERLCLQFTSVVARKPSSTTPARAAPAAPAAR